MQNETTKDPEIIALLEGRTQASLENIRQFILDLDERDYMDFLYPSDPDFAQELEGRAAETKGMLYERTAISRKPAQLARKELDALRDEDRVSPDLVFRDPYLLDFLGLKDTYSEKDLETAILHAPRALGTPAAPSHSSGSRTVQAATGRERGTEMISQEGTV